MAFATIKHEGINKIKSITKVGLYFHGYLTFTILQLMTLPGKTARRKLKEDVTYSIQETLARFFRSTEGNVGQGLHYVTLNYRSGESYII